MFRRVFSPSTTLFDRVAKTIDLLTHARSDCFTGIPVTRAKGTQGRRGINGGSATRREPRSLREKKLATEKRRIWKPSNVTETLLNNGFGEVQERHPSHLSPTNSPDEASL